MKSVVILISGRGSNMEAIVGAGLPAKVAAVISNRADAAGLKFAAQSGIAVQVVDEREFSSRGAFDAALEAAIERHSPDLVALAGLMRILGRGFVRKAVGRPLEGGVGTTGEDTSGLPAHSDIVWRPLASEKKERVDT